MSVGFRRTLVLGTLTQSHKWAGAAGTARPVDTED